MRRGFTPTRAWLRTARAVGRIGHARTAQRHRMIAHEISVPNVATEADADLFYRVAGDRLAVERLIGQSGMSALALRTATEFEFFAAITGTRCVTVGSSVRRGGRSRCRVCAHRGAALQRVGGKPPVHSREHVLMSPNHGIDGGTPKLGKLLIVHFEKRPHFTERLFSTVNR